MDRRTALKRMLAGFAGAFSIASGSRLGLSVRPAYAQVPGAQKTMILIFQRGGCDGLSVAVPYADPKYYPLRPRIRIPAPDATSDAAALDLDGYFGLNPALRGMHDIFGEGRLAVLPAVHYSEASRSHFDSQFIIESGAHDILESGFLNRYLEQAPNDATFRAVSMGTSVADMLRGEIIVPAVDALDGFGFETGDEYGCTDYQVTERLQQVYAQEAGTKDNAMLVYNQTRKMFEDMEVFEQFEADYQPANGALYPDTDYGRHLRIIAQLIKEGVGLEVASVSIGGWDTHSGQGSSDDPDSNLYGHLSHFSAGVRALYQDLGATMSDVVIVTGTEFGRTAEENGNQGTDHGHASTWFVAGGGVQSGLYGEWPTLAPNRLNDGRYLDHTVDYRDILSGILRDHLGASDLSGIFPGHRYTNLGMFA